MNKLILLISIVILASCNSVKEDIKTDDLCSFILPSNLYLEVNSLGHYTIVDTAGNIIDRELDRDNLDFKWGFDNIKSAFKYAFKDSCEAKAAAISYLNQDEYETFKKVK